MRIVMTFVVRDEDAAGVERWRKVLAGPAWGVGRAEPLFELMAFHALDGAKSLDLLTIGLARARAELPSRPEPERQVLARMVESLTTWAVVARIRGADTMVWTTDF